MSEALVSQRRRRSRAEAEQLVAEYEASGASRGEFCRTHELALATLVRYLRRRRPRPEEAAEGGRWVAVELAGAEPRTVSGLTVVLAGGRRIEVGRGFAADTLVQLVRLLEAG